MGFIRMEITKGLASDIRQQSLAVLQRLQQTYGSPGWGVSMSPVDELVSTILSQNTNDANRDRAYKNLQKRFPTWEEVRDAPPVRVIETIRTAGLANKKGPRIQEVLRAITAERGSLNLGFLLDWPVDQAYDWLTQFKGVGPKTASIVLLFSFGKPVFPVDTHIYRVTGRLGLRPPIMSVEQTHQHLANLFPIESYRTAHLNLIRLGREVCHPHKPECPTCPINDLCEYYSIQNEEQTL